MLNRDQWVNALMAHNDTKQAVYFETLVDYLASSDSDSEDDAKFHALDPSVIGDDGYAFLWSDVLDAEEIVKTLLTMGLSPNQLATVAAKLVKAWKRLRQRRVKLTPTQFVVLRAIRNGATTQAEVVKVTNLDAGTVDVCIVSLMGMTYGESTKVVEDIKGQFVTAF